MKRRLVWVTCFLLAVSVAGAEEITPPSPDDTAPPVSWRDRYLLGPGDILDFAFYGHPELDRNQVFVQPDGTISYLQAQGIKAEGLTIDELRATMEAELSRHYRHVRVMVFPFELRSKRYFILGKIVDKGAFPMDRPITIIEAVARARGIETGLFEQNTVELADLPRSFLIRQGKRLPIDFEKLFQEGDFSQNIQIEPGDFIYFPSANTNEIYVLGEIALPGVQGFTPNSSVVGVIAMRGGYTENAYRKRILVIRGSLENPERFVINTDDILAGRVPDFRLQPKDIVYVSSRPWSYAEELVDMAIDTFLQAMTATWAGTNMPYLLPSGVLPQREAPR